MQRHAFFKCFPKKTADSLSCKVFAQFIVLQRYPTGCHYLSFLPILYMNT